VQIEASGLRKRFGALCAIDGVGFELPAGRRTALVGPNGSGKSTLNRIVMGLLACDGEVRVDGRSPFRERVAIAQRMAYVPQAAPQLGAPVGELVRTVARVRGLDAGRIAAVARRLDLALEALAPRPLRSCSRLPSPPMPRCSCSTSPPAASTATVASASSSSWTRFRVRRA
jgi:ABC-2 type transport system ATP-binding protein